MRRFIMAASFVASQLATVDVQAADAIFPPQAKHVHSSSLVELANGDLVACWYHGSGERQANDVVIQGARLRRGADSWSPVFLMADTPGLPDCNPVLYLDTRQRLWLFWIVPVANRWEQSVLKYRRSDDPAPPGPIKWTWQDSIHLVPGETFADVVDEAFKVLQPHDGLWAEYALPYARLIREAATDPVKRQMGWMPRTHPLTLATGRILLPLYSDGFNISLMAISDDMGETWRASQPIVGLGPIQPTVVRREDGTLVAYMRDSGDAPHRVLMATSDDDGESWSIATDTEIPNSGSSLEIIRLHDGKWAMAYNDTEHGRYRLTLALSSDQGKMWSTTKVLEYDPTQQASYSYPSIMQDRKGRVHVTYSHSDRGMETIRHAAIDID